MESLKKIWVFIVGAFALLAGLFLFERKQKVDAEVALENFEFKAKDGVLKESQEAGQASIDIDISRDSGNSVRTYTTNVSVGGLCVKDKALALNVGDSIHLSLNLGTQVDVTGRVVWKKNENTGICFDANIHIPFFKGGQMFG